MEAFVSPIKVTTNSWQVALVSMPFMPHFRPSIQLGLLKSICTGNGFPTTTFHLSLDFAQQIDPTVYEILGEPGRDFLIGDWLFSAAAFGKDAPDQSAQFLQHFHSAVDKLLAKCNKPREYLFTLRNEEVPKYLDQLMECIAWEQFQIVGFTSTFQQNMASFALAARIKRKFPEITLLFGGANFEGEMGLELVRSIPCIDYAVIGEGDCALPELLTALKGGHDPTEVPGVACRRDGRVSQPRSRPLFSQMDSLPLPDYDEYFDRAEALGLLSRGPRRIVNIPFESARGCWWGQKHHCTFCGLNGKTTTFRAKSPTRVQEELAQLARRFRSFHFGAVDNILDMSYLKTLLPKLIQEGTDYVLFCETKANLTREQIKLLYDAGVRRFQPGIESLNSHVLQLMNKGVTAIQNVNTLRWGRYYDMHIAWNLLYGFPQEALEDYREQERIIRNITHLEPPAGAGRIWMERFSPIFCDRELFPAHYVRPASSYQYIYPDYVDLNRVAYFFDYQLENVLPDSAFEETHRLVEIWQEAWQADKKPSLIYWSTEDFLQIEDLRNPAEPGTYTFTDPLASIYTALSNRPHTATKVKELLALLYSVDEIEAALDEFCTLGLMMRDGQYFLSLALPATRGR